MKKGVTESPASKGGKVRSRKKSQEVSTCGGQGKRNKGVTRQKGKKRQAQLTGQGGGVLTILGKIENKPLKLKKGHSAKGGRQAEGGIEHWFLTEETNISNRRAPRLLASKRREPPLSNGGVKEKIGGPSLPGKRDRRTLGNLCLARQGNRLN